jgi:hypothetical protein
MRCGAWRPGRVTDRFAGRIRQDAMRRIRAMAAVPSPCFTLHRPEVLVMTSSGDLCSRVDLRYVPKPFTLRKIPKDILTGGANEFSTR